MKKMIIKLNMKPPRTTSQQKGARIVNGHISFYTKDKVRAVLNDYKEKLEPYKLSKPLVGALHVNIKFLYKGKGVWKETRPDLDNMVKLLLDAMTQCGFWEDDSQIVILNAGKLYSDHDEIEIGITQL